MSGDGELSCTARRTKSCLHSRDGGRGSSVQLSPGKFEFRRPGTGKQIPLWSSALACWQPILTSKGSKGKHYMCFPWTKSVRRHGVVLVHGKKSWVKETTRKQLWVNHWIPSRKQGEVHCGLPKGLLEEITQLQGLPPVTFQPRSRASAHTSHSHPSLCSPPPFTWTLEWTKPTTTSVARERWMGKRGSTCSLLLQASRWASGNCARPSSCFLWISRN